MAKFENKNADKILGGRTKDNKKQLPYIEKYLIPNYYEILKFGGVSVRDEEEEIQRMMVYFPGCFTKEQLIKRCYLFKSSQKGCLPYQKIYIYTLGKRKE